MPGRRKRFMTPIESQLDKWTSEWAKLKRGIDAGRDPYDWTLLTPELELEVKQRMAWLEERIDFISLP